MILSGWPMESSYELRICLSEAFPVNRMNWAWVVVERLGIYSVDGYLNQYWSDCLINLIDNEMGKQ